MLHKLPPETVVEILLNLDAFDLIRAQLVCHLFFKTITTDPALQYRIELYAASMEDNPYVQMSISDRLLALRERSDQCLTLSTDDEPPNCDQEFLHPWGYDPLEWFFSNGILIVKDEKNKGPTEKYIVRDLRVEGEGEKEWQCGRPGERYGGSHYVLIDALQDLLITVNDEDGMSDLTRFTIHFISLRLGTPHPEAFKPRMDFEFGRFGDIAPTITTHGGRYIVVLERSPITSRTHIIDWKTGEEKIIEGPYAAYKVLNEDYILFCSYVSTKECPISLAVVPLNGSSTSPLLILNYPAFKGFFAFHFRPEFIPGGPTDFRSCSRLSSSPFHPSLEDSIIILNLKRATGFSDVLWTYTSLFRSSDILRHLLALNHSGTGDSAARKPVTLRWGEWRESNFGEIGGKSPRFWFWDTVTSGSRFATFVRGELFLFDFERRLAFNHNTNVPGGADKIKLDPEHIEEQAVGRAPEQEDGKNKKGKIKKKPNAKVVPWEGIQRPPPIPCYMYKMSLPEGTECIGVRQFSMDATRLVVARNPPDDKHRDLLYVYKWMGMRLGRG